MTSAPGSPAQQLHHVLGAEYGVIIAHDEPADARGVQPGGLHDHARDADDERARLREGGEPGQVLGDLQAGTWSASIFCYFFFKFNVSFNLLRVGQGVWSRSPLDK